MSAELSPKLQALADRARAGGLRVEVETDRIVSVVIYEPGEFPQRILLTQFKGYSGRWTHYASLALTPIAPFKAITLREATRFIATHENRK